MQDKLCAIKTSKPLLRPLLLKNVLIGCILVLLTAFSTNVAADGRGVRYSYEYVDPVYVLIPHADNALRGETTPELLERAFHRLRRLKRDTYGDTEISVQGKTSSNAKVVVTIDSAHAPYAPIIMAEIVYTLTELGAKSVAFPGYFDGEMTRKDIPFSAYSLNLPLWLAVGSDRLAFSQVILPDGTLRSGTEIQERWKKGDDDLKEMIYSYLNATDLYTVVALATQLPDLGLYHPDRVLSLITHKEFEVRKVALGLIANEKTHEGVLDAVVNALENEQQPELAQDWAKFLGQATPAKYNVRWQFYRIEHFDADEVVDAVKTLASYENDARVNAKLNELLIDERIDVASQAAQSLKSIGDEQSRITALQNDAVDDTLRMTIARELSSQATQNVSKIAGWQYLALNLGEGQAADAMAEIARIPGHDARQTIEAFLTNDTQHLRISAAKTLAEFAGVDALPALAKAVRADQNADIMEDAAYHIMLRQSLNDVLQHTRERDTTIQRVAYRALGELAVRENAHGRVFETLRTGTGSRDPLIRGACAQALGTFATDQSLGVLKVMVNDKSAQVRKDVAIGLGNFNEPELYDVLMKYLSDSSADVVAAALDSLEKRGDSQAWEAVWPLAQSSEYQVRRSALRAITSLRDKSDSAVENRILSLLSGAVNDSHIDVKEMALQQLGRFNEETAVMAIAIQLNAAEKMLRMAAIRALGQTGHASALDLVLSTIDDPDVDIRRVAIESVGLLKNAAAKPTLEQRLQNEQDPEMVELLKSTIRSI